MEGLNKVLIGLAAVAFLLAVVSTVLSTAIGGVSPEAFSRACSNIALIAIAISVTSKAKSSGS